MALDQFRYQSVKSAARCRRLLQDLVTVLTFQHGAFETLNLALDASYPTQYSAIFCNM
jgi:hypothetical protein